MYNKRLGVRDMTSEWRDHVATRAREIAADKETEPYRYDVRDEPVNTSNKAVDADLEKYWHATQGDKL